MAAAQQWGQFAGRLATLIELQSELLKLDLVEGLRGFRRMAVFLLAGAIIAVGSVPVVLTVVAEACRQWFGLSSTLAFAIAAGLGLLVAMAALLVGWRMAGQGLAALERSRRAAAENLAWLKETWQRQMAAREPLAMRETDERNRD